MRPSLLIPAIAIFALVPVGHGLATDPCAYERGEYLTLMVTQALVDGAPQSVPPMTYFLQMLEDGRSIEAGLYDPEWLTRRELRLEAAP